MNTPRSQIFGKDCADGFTLTELLVVVGTVGILGLLLLPAIAGTKPNSQAFQCLENQRQLTLGWQMYASDNNDLLPPNDYPYLTGYATMSAAIKATYKNWVVGTMALALDAGDAPAGSGVSELLDPNTLLSRYITNRPVYRCPADNYVDPYAGNRVHVRSYSMNAAVGTVFHSSSTYTSGGPAMGSAVPGGWLTGSSYNANQTTWLTYGKMTSFTKPGPAGTFVFMDENARTINDGAFEASAAATPGHTYLIDYPAGNHNRAAALSFADGHGIIHKWQDQRTYTVPVSGQGNSQVAPTKPVPDDVDCFYLAQITSASK